MAPAVNGRTGTVLAVPDQDPSREIRELREEVDRLRALVGPSEASYERMREDLLAARDAARGAHAEAGSLRGLNAELHVHLARARQDQDHLQRLVGASFNGVVARLFRSARARLF
jgi:predicted  nucleic acid-binding Zn-ribbon protein